MTAATLLPLALLGAVAGLDVVSFPQAMLSRPLVSATLGGAFCGRPGAGLLAGAALELFALETRPFGASRYPEWGSAGVVGGALFATHTDGHVGVLAFAVVAALCAAGVGGWSMVQHRHLIGRWAGAGREVLAAGSREAVTGLQLRGLLSDLVRGGLVTAVALAVFEPLARGVLDALHAGASSRGVVAVLAGASAGAAVWSLVHTVKGGPWLYAGGLAVGTVVAIAL